MASKTRSNLTYRVRGILPSVDITTLQKGLELLLETQDLHIDSLVPTSIGRQGQVATIRVASPVKLPSTHDEWLLPPGPTLVANPNNKRLLAIDTHFRGFTPLYSPASDTELNLE